MSDYRSYNNYQQNFLIVNHPLGKQYRQQTFDKIQSKTQLSGSFADTAGNIGGTNVF